MKKQYFKNFRKEGLPGGPNEITINSEGFILSENGQWEFPGLPTVIPSSDITMEDVPYPVLGISDTGDTQMMYPEEDYQFDGDMVYELPMAQKGYNVKPRKGSILVEGETEPSTHLMRREYIPNTGWVAFPSLFQNEDGTWLDMSKEEDWMNIYDEANRRGEVYNFGENKRKAIKFADKGSWKKDLGIKKQGGGDISIPDLTKPNWLNNLPKAQNGKGLQTASDSLYHQLGKIADYEFNLGRADGTGLTNYGNPKLGSNPSKKQAVDWILDNTIPIVKKYYTSPTEQAEAADFVYNTGRDPRIYQLDQYLKSIGQSGLPDRGSFNMDYYGDPDPNSKTKLVELDKLWNQYKDNIQKLSENDRRILLNKGRDFYYRNINKKSDGSPSDAYYNTWYGRIWNTNDYTDFNRNNPNFKPKKQKGGWLDTLPKAQSGKTREPIYVDPNDLLGMQRYNAYNDSLNLYNRGERNYQTRLAFNRANNIPTSSIRTWNDPIAYDGDSPARIQPIQGNGYFFNHSPDVVARTNIPSSSVDNYGFRYKKPVQPYAIRKTEPRIPYSPVQINQLNTVQLPINNIPLQQMPTIGIGEPTFEGNNAYWKKQDNQLIYQNNDYSNNRNLPISNKPGDRFHQEPSWMVGDDRYYERDGEAYLVPQPKGGWSRKQILDPSSGKWKSKIVKKQKGGGVDELQDGSNTLYHSRKPIEGKQDPYQLMRFIKSYIGPNDLDIQERPYKKPIPSYKDLYKDIYYDLYPDQIRGDKKVQKGGWLDTLPKAQNGNTGEQSANESWGLTQESQLSDLTKGLLNNILHRQAFAESSFNPKVISGDKTSRVGALGMTQIMPETLNEYIDKTGDKNINILDPKDAVKVQKWYMQDLLNADFIHKPNQSEKVRMVKALGSYNWGRGNMSKFLGKQKKKGVDIYSDEMSWVNDLPDETRDYVNKIVLGTNEKFNQEYKQNSSKYRNYYQKGGWLNNLPMAQNGKMLTREKKRLLKEKEFEDFLKKSSVDEQGTLTYVLPEYTVKSPEKKLYDEAYNKSIAQQQAFQNSWYPGSTDSDNLGYAPGVMDNIKQRATVKANDFVAKNLVNNNKIGDLKDYQKDYIATSNYSGKLRPNIGKQFTEGVQDLSRITQGKLPTSKSLGILSPLEYPVNLVRGTVKGEGVDALKGNISSPWLDANDVDPGAVNDVGVYNTMTDLALDPLNFSGAGVSLGKSGVKYLNKALKTSKESGVLSNTYKINPWALKENPEMFLYRAEPTDFNSQSTIDFMKQEIAAGREKPWYKGTIKSYEEGHPKLIAQNDFHGQWFEKNPNRLDFYLNSGDKYEVGTPMNIIRKKISTSEANKFSVVNNPKANVISASPETEFILPKNMISSAERFPESSWQELIQQDKAFNTPHWLRGYKKVPKNLPSNTSPVQSGFPNPLGIVDAVANRSAIQYAGSEPYLFNPQTNTWEILRNEINDKYRQGYTDIPQFNEQLKQIKATMQFGKRPLLNKADFVNPNQAEIDMLFNKHTTYKGFIPETNFKALEKEAEEMGIPMDNLLKRTLEKLAYKSNRDPLTSKPFYFNPENPRVPNRAVLYSNPNYSKMFGKELNEIGPLGGKTTSEIPRYYQDQINRYTDMLEIATESQKISIQNKIIELYKKGLNQTIDKNAKPFTGKDALQYIEPNKKGGQKKGWLDKL